MKEGRGREEVAVVGAWPEFLEFFLFRGWSVRRSL